MMKPEYCPDYVGVACVDGTCPVANCEEYTERCMPVISCCRDCFYYKGCEDCAISDDCDRMEDKHMVKNNLNVTAVANTLPMQRNTVLYHLDKIERETKLNPRHIHDLIDLLEIALEVL